MASAFFFQSCQVFLAEEAASHNKFASAITSATSAN